MIFLSLHATPVPHYSREDLTVVLLQLCHTLKLEDDTLPTLTTAVINKLQQLREEKEVSVGISVCVFDCLSVCLSACLSVCLSVFLPVCCVQAACFCF